jgi:hypothetical protein
MSHLVPLLEFNQYSITPRGRVRGRDEDEYEMPNAKREAPGENARKRSWKRWAASAAVIRRRQGYVGQGGDK